MKLMPIIIKINNGTFVISQQFCIVYYLGSYVEFRKIILVYGCSSRLLPFCSKCVAVHCTQSENLHFLETWCQLWFILIWNRAQICDSKLCVH